MSQYNGTLSMPELETLWVQAGGPASAEHLAAAIAEAESGGSINSTDHDSNGTVDRGLWQINSIHGTQSTYDPLANAQAAVAISNQGSNWTPWVTFNSGAYRKFLGGSTPSANTSNTPTTSQPNTPAPTPTSNTNPLLPKPSQPRGTGKALEYLAYILLFAIGAGLLYTGITRTTGRTGAQA
jgi:hypothetical protein